MELLADYNNTSHNLIELLKKDIEIYNDDVKSIINNYISFLSKQNENNVSYACKMCIFQNNIYDIINNQSFKDECQKYDIDILTEYNKYIIRTPEDNETLINHIADFDFFNNLQNFYNKTSSSKIEYLKKYKIINSYKNIDTKIQKNQENQENQENQKGGAINFSTIADYFINFGNMITKFTVDLMFATAQDIKKGSKQSLIVFSKSIFNINNTSLIKIKKEGLDVLEKRMNDDPSYLYSNLFCEANTTTSLTLNLIINNFITFLVRILLIVKKSGSFIINFKKYTASDIIFSTFFSIVIPLFIVFFTFIIPFVSFSKTYLDVNFINDREELINIILSTHLINLVLIPIYIKFANKMFGKYHDTTITRFIADSSTLGLTDAIKVSSLISNDLTTVSSNIANARFIKFKINNFFKNLIKNPSKTINNKDMKTLVLNIMRIDMETITLYDLEKRKLIIDEMQKNKDLELKLIEKGFDLDNFYKNMASYK
jgi:hypothetical protein